MTEMSQTEDRSELKMEVILDGDCGIVGRLGTEPEDG